MVFNQASLLALLTFLSLASRSFAAVGVDVSQPVSESQWKCLQSPGGQGSISFAIVRVYQSVGRVDSDGVRSVKAARNAGVRFVDGYLFPCVPSSCPSPEAQVNSTVCALRSAGADIGMLWYDVERLSWSSDHGKNQAFLKRMIEAGRSLGVKAGVYSNWNSWSEIMTKAWSFPHDQGLPVWYPHYDGSQSFSDFQSFGGWSKPNIKQYFGDKSSCGVGVDYNWY